MITLFTFLIRIYVELVNNYKSNLLSIAYLKIYFFLRILYIASKIKLLSSCLLHIYVTWTENWEDLSQKTSCFLSYMRCNRKKKQAISKFNNNVTRNKKEKTYVKEYILGRTNREAKFRWRRENKSKKKKKSAYILFLDIFIA